MRILFLPQCFPPVRGGGEWHAWRLSTALAGQGATVRVVTSNLMRVIARGGHKASAFQPASECVDGVDGVDIRRHEYGTPLGRTLLRSPWTPFPLRRRARRRAYRRFVARFEAAVKGELRSFAPDVVLTMAHLQASVRVAFRLRAREAFPLAYVPLLHAEDAMAREPEMQRYLRAADVVITNTEFERAFVTGEHGVAPERVVRGGLGADLPASVEPLPPRHVLFVGRLDPDKGIGRLVDAMRRLWRDGLEWPLVLLGSRCYATRAIDGMLRRLPSADRARVAMREDVSDEARDRALREAACLVLPSRLESFGLVLLESWAQGVPVVTWDLPLYREIVTSGEDGLLARPDDTADLADRIRTVAADPELRSRLGRAGRIKVERDHAWSAVGGRVLEALERARTGPLRSAGCFPYDPGLRNPQRKGAWTHVLKLVRPVRTHSLTFLLLLLAGAAGAEGSDPGAPRVVFRGARTLGHLLEITTHPAWRDPQSPRAVALVVDVTPFVAFAKPEIVAALETLDRRVSHERGNWRMGRLGEPLAFQSARPGALAKRLDLLLAKEARTANTIAALENSLAAFRTPGGVVVYIADRHFEDHEGLEAFVEMLRRRGQIFSVIGPEAAFGQPFDDAVHRTGRTPFDEDKRAPWRSGDVAWPRWPSKLRVNTWYYRRGRSVPVDLAERLWAYARDERRGKAPDRPAFLADVYAGHNGFIGVYAPPPSSFGPYGLMRACARTGGRYGLWSWSPRPGTGPTYDYGRCNRYAPDLRSLEAMRSDVPDRPCLLALLRAWHRVSQPWSPLAEHTPPFNELGTRPTPMVPVHTRGLPSPWRSATSRTQYLDGMHAALAVFDEAIGDLEATIAATPAEASDTVGTRIRADAELFLHMLRMQRFHHAEQMASFLAWELEAPPDVPRDRLRFQPQTWVRGGPAPDALHVGDKRPYDKRAALTLLRAHRDFLRRYQGTPYGEAVARNNLVTSRIVFPSAPTTGRSRLGPAASSGKTPVTPPPTTSSGSTPGTGR